jgi:hypothetical protein
LCKALLHFAQQLLHFICLYSLSKQPPALLAPTVPGQAAAVGSDAAGGSSVDQLPGDTDMLAPTSSDMEALMQIEKARQEETVSQGGRPGSGAVAWNGSPGNQAVGGMNGVSGRPGSASSKVKNTYHANQCQA